MSREVLFKAKRKDNGEWVEGYLYKHQYFAFIFPQITNGSYNGTKKVMKFMNPCFEVDSDTICQYTGLTDKNGNKIWENDIVEIPTEDENFKIEWQEDTASFAVRGKSFIVTFDNYWSYETEVISNIFDNPELLEV